VTIFEKSGTPLSITEGERAIRLFTDRGALVRLFCERLHADPPIERILFIHGDGGNGKTLALRYLRACACKHLPAAEWRAAAALADDEAFRRRIEECPNAVPAPWVGLDFAAVPVGNDRPQEAFYGLLMLRRQIAPLHLDFPRFDLAVLWYLRETGQLTRQRVESLFPAEALDLAVALAGVVADIPWIGVGKAALGLFDRHLGQRFTLYRARRRLDEADVQEIQRLPANPDLIDLLPDLFARDLSTAMTLGGAPERLVLAFDTHEALWGRERDLGDAAFFARDAWLRRLLGNLELGAGIVAVVAGRDRPRWPEAPAYPIPAACLDVLSVGNLSDADAQDYLARAGVVDPALRAHLATYTGGHPYFLGLCADVVLAASARGVALTQDDFEAGESLEAKETLLVQRLLKYVDRPLEYAVRALCAARAFDWEIYAALGEALHFETSEPGLQALTGFSFVLPTGAPGAAGGRYRIHELLRRLLADEPTARRADAALEAYYRARDDEPAQAEAIYHAFRQDPGRGIAAWCDVMEASLDGARYSLCERLVEVRREMPVTDPFWMGWVLGLQGQYHAGLSQHEEARQAYDDAVAACDQALQRALDAVAAHNNKGSALRSLGDLLAGLSRHQEALQAYRDATAAYDQALLRAPDAVAAHNNKGSALSSLGELLAGLSRHEEALQAYRDAVAACDQALRRAPDLVAAHNNKGNALRGLGDLLAGLSRHEEARQAYTEAVAACDQALLRAPDDVAAHNNKGLALSRLGDLLAGLSRHEEARRAYTDAVAAYDQALLRAPDLVAAHNNKGLALRGLGDLLAGLSRHEEARQAYRDAVASYDQALLCAPDFVVAHSNRGDALWGLGKVMVGLSQRDEARRSYESAIAALDQALALAPNDADVYSSKGTALDCLGELLVTVGRYEEARQAYEAAVAAFDAALERAPDKIDTYNNKGIALSGHADVLVRLDRHESARQAYAAAVAAYDQALLRAPDDVYAHNNKGNALSRLGELLAGLSQPEESRQAYRDAVAACDQALLRAPDYVHAHHNKGRALRSLGNLLAGLSWHEEARQAYTDAVAAFDQALLRAPEAAYLHRNRAETLMLARRADEAEVDLSWALEHDPDALLTRARLGQLHLAQGRYAEAEQEFRRLVEAGAGDWRGFQALALLALGRAGEADAVLDAWLETAGAHDRFEVCLWLALLPGEVRDTEAAGALRERLRCA
jgi:tetratricopeptide (TPR) repeat protein